MKNIIYLEYILNNFLGENVWKIYFYSFESVKIYIINVILKSLAIKKNLNFNINEVLIHWNFYNLKK